jgi:uncharacterized membrane protein
MTSSAPSRPPATQQLSRWIAGTGLAFAGTSHVSFAREGFRAQVPPWVPFDTDDVVLASGAAEIALGLGLLTLPGQRRRMEVLATTFLIGVFPGNIAQYRNRVGGLGLDTDRKRLVRLLVEPLMWATALHAGGLLPRRAVRRSP